MYFQDIVGEKMRVEKQLIKKMYYETFLMENETKQPLDVLGEVYVNEEKNEISDGSYIRFAQGEFTIVIKILKQLFLNGRRFVMN